MDAQRATELYASIDHHACTSIQEVYALWGTTLSAEIQTEFVNPLADLDTKSRATELLHDLTQPKKVDLDDAAFVAQDFFKDRLSLSRLSATDRFVLRNIVAAFDDFERNANQALIRAVLHQVNHQRTQIIELRQCVLERLPDTTKK